jgi:hypothetical protein
MILMPQCFIESLWIAKQWVFANGGHLSIFHTPSPHTHSWTFNPWKVTTNASSLKFLLDLPTSTFELAKPLNVALTLNQEKFTWSCLCESPFDLGTMSTFRFVDPKTSWPSKWSIIIVKKDLLVYLVMALTICNGLLDWLIHHNLNSSLPRPSSHLPPFKYTL